MAVMAYEPRDVAAALSRIGHDARFTEVAQQLQMENNPRTVTILLMAARDAGLVTQLGTPGRKNSRWVLTPAGEQVAEPDSEPAPSGTRDAIIGLLERGELYDSRQLARALAILDRERFGSLGTHSLQHQLYAMEKQGMVEFDVRRDGSAVSIRNIRLAQTRQPRKDLGHSRRVSQVGIDRTEPGAHGSRAQGGPIERLRAPEGSPQTAATPEPEPEPVSDPYPVLAAIRARVASAATDRALADAYLRAAESLAAFDPAESDRLLGLASDVAADDLSDVETEYLAFAEGKA